jgi:DNA-binding XRE family transcriptional regulator
MAEDMQIGGRISRLRRQRRLAQADLAAAIGISGSYLNLIGTTAARSVPLLRRSPAISASKRANWPTARGRLAGDLMEMFGDDVFADADVTNVEVDLAHSIPGSSPGDAASL